MSSWRCFPFVESAPRAYRLKASNAAPSSSTSIGTIPPWIPKRLDAEALRGLSLLPAFPHRGISGFDMPAKPIGIEQRKSQPVLFEPLPKPAKERVVGRKLQGQSFVLIEAVRHQLRQPDGVQQAGRYPAGKRLPAAGQQREPRPQRIARRRVGIIGYRIEEQIGQAMARQVLIERKPCCKH